MRISDFLGEEPFDYESLGVPAVPDDLTRPLANRYRVRLETYLQRVDAELKEEAEHARLVPVREYFGSKRSRRLRAAIKTKRRNRWYHADATFVSDTKRKKQRKEYASRSGTPVHMREESDNEKLRNELRACRDTARLLIEELAKRFPNLAPADFVRPNRRPEPQIEDYQDAL